MASYYKLEEVLRATLAEPSLAKARNSFRTIISELRQLRKSGESNDNLFRLAALAYGYLASLEDVVDIRSSTRVLAAEVCREGLTLNPNSAILAVTYANTVVDWFYDSFAERNTTLIRSKLAGARKECQRLLKVEQEGVLRVQLFVQLSSIFRCQAYIHGKQGGLSLAQTAVSTSEAASKADPASALGLLSLGLSLQSLSRWSEKESNYFSLMQESETALIEADSRGLSLATVSLARLYRQTYRPDEAIDWFLKYYQREKQSPRLALADSHIAAEAAVFLLHRNLDTTYVQERLRSVDALLNEAIDAGYKNARILISLARIRFGLGDSVGGLNFLRDIARGETTDWNLAVHTAREAIENENFELLLQTFALGIADGAVWNSLGTFTKEVLLDSEFAISLYKTGLKLNPKSAVLHTNLARLYLDTSALPEAKRHLEAAERHADFSFRWWKPLYDVVCRQLKQTPQVIYGYRRSSDGDSLDLIYSEFLHLERETTGRGKKLEHLFVRTLKLTYGTVNVRGSIEVEGVQCDATFKHGTNFYRAEISWDARPNGPSEVIALIGRVSRTVGVRGLLVSMSGFTKGVVDEVELRKGQFMILLMPKEDFGKVLRGDIRMETWMEEKEREWFLRSTRRQKV